MTPSHFGITRMLSCFKNDKEHVLLFGWPVTPNFRAAWSGHALILSPIISDHSLTHYLHCTLLHQKNICEHYLTNWSLNEPLAKGAFRLPLGSQSGPQKKNAYRCKAVIRKGERTLVPALLGGCWGVEGGSERKGGWGERGGSKPYPVRKSTFSKGNCLLAAVVKLLNSLSASREKPKPLWTKRKGAAEPVARSSRRESWENSVSHSTVPTCQEPTGVQFTIVQTVYHWYHSRECILCSSVWEQTAVSLAQDTGRGAREEEGERDTDFFPISLRGKALIHQPKTHGLPARRLTYGQVPPRGSKESPQTIEGDFKVNKCTERPRSDSATPVRKRCTQQSLRKCLL